MTDDQSPAESANLSALSDLCTPWCIHVVATLRIADHIAAGATEIKTLAERAGCDADYLQRVLRHLVSKGVFAEPVPGQFALNKAALEVQRFGLYLDGIGGRIAHAWGTLLTAVRTGKPALLKVNSYCRCCVLKLPILILLKASLKLLHSPRLFADGSCSLLLLDSSPHPSCPR